MSTVKTEGDVRLVRGALIVFEGIDGAGKTTQARLLAERLIRAGLSVVETKEPTSGVFGRRVRESAQSGRLDPTTELDLFERDRREHVAGLIKPNLDSGTVVIVDRYYFSTAAYQGARGLDPESILVHNESFAPQPDLLVLLDVPVREAMERIRRRGDGEGNLFEREADLKRCAAIFGDIRRPFLMRVDGTKRPDEIARLVLDRVRERVVFRAACHKPDLDECEPEYCTFRLQHQCDYPVFRSVLAAKTTSVINEVERLTSDPDLSDQEKLERTRLILARESAKG